MEVNTMDTVVLIIEDGDEYLDSLSQFVQGPEYLQAKSGEQAVEILQTRMVDLIYLDMRFDRIPMTDLLGDHVKATREHNGDPLRAFKFLQNNQGLFILEKLRKENLVHIPVILAYDFSRQQKRYEHLKRIHQSLRWVPDAVTPTEIRNLMNECIVERAGR
jgi:ActR/RegA family two-component response regulator